jgi:ATP-dependent Clp protease ATP-binding subunit ClpA
VGPIATIFLASPKFEIVGPSVRDASHVKKPLAEELLFGRVVKGGSVKVTMKDGKLDFEIIEAALPALPKPDEDGDDGSDKEQEVEV